MTTDVNSVRLTATATAVAHRTRVRSVVLTGTAGAGSLTLRDGGAGGPILLQLDTLANSAIDVDVPGDGVLFGTDVHATISGLAAVVIFHG